MANFIDNSHESLHLVASCAFGLEAIVQRELAARELEARITGPGQVEFSGSWREVCEANLWLRCADRVSVILRSEPCADFDTLFDTTKQIAWESWLPPRATIHVTGGSVKSQLSSVPAIQRTVKRAIVDQLLQLDAYRDGDGGLPEDGPVFRIHISLRDDEARWSLDTTGASLHKRGYREISTKAPLKETMAAALVLLSFWKPERPLIDPFCGGGTIPIEAALIGRNMAPGLQRAFACETWPAIPAGLWDEVRGEALAAQLPSLPQRLLGTDIHAGALSLARRNAERAGVAHDIHFQQLAFDQLSSQRQFGCMITNPPYGDRLDPGELRQLYESIPLVLRRLPTWSHFILTAFPGFEALIGKHADRRRKLYNGRIECTYFQFHGPPPQKSSRVEGEVAKETGDEQSTQSAEGISGQLDLRATVLDPNFAPSRERVAMGPESAFDSPSLPADSNPELAPSPTLAMHPSSVPSVRLAPNAPSPTNTSSDPSRQTTASPRPRPPRQTIVPVFGGIDAKAREQAELFASRLRKRSRHLRRWPTRREITCFRLYERDIPEIPVVVDRYEDHLHIVEFERPHDRDLAQHADWFELMVATAGEVLEIPAERIFAKSRQRQRGLAQHEKLDESGHELVVREGGLKFIVNLSDYTDTGLFLDHRAARSMIREHSAGRRVLNLFGYTGAFSVYAADGKADVVTTVDLSSTYLHWARRNMQLNFEIEPHCEYVRADAGSFVANLPEEPLFDLIVCDPPTFSNSKRTEDTWQVQRDHGVLLEQLLRRLSTDGALFFSTNFRRFKLDEDRLGSAQVREITKKTLPEDFRNQRIHRSWWITPQGTTPPERQRDESATAAKPPG